MGAQSLRRFCNKRTHKVGEKSFKNSYLQNHSLKIKSRLWGPHKRSLFICLLSCTLSYKTSTLRTTNWTDFWCGLTQDVLPNHLQLRRGKKLTKPSAISKQNYATSIILIPARTELKGPKLSQKLSREP